MPKGTPAAFRPEKNIFANGFIELKKVFNQLKTLAVLKRFLLAFFFYNMGVQTIMLVATLFGSKAIKIAYRKVNYYDSYYSNCCYCRGLHHGKAF